MSPDGMGLGLGYLQTGPFLDHLAVIKIQIQIHTNTIKNEEIQKMSTGDTADGW